MEFVIYVFYILAGAGVGLAIGLTGVGGGSLMTPLLILFGFEYNVAIGTDLLYAAVTKSGGVFAHQRQGNVNWRLALLLSLGSIPSSILTASLLDQFFTNAMDYRPILTRSLGVMLFLTSLVLVFRRRLQKTAIEDPGTVSRWLQGHSVPLTLLMGVALGVLVTLSSVGAGAFCAAMLLLFYPRLSALQVVGTDIAHAVPLTFIAGMGHFLLLGNVDFKLLGCLLLGSLPAIHFGTLLASKLPNNVMMPFLASALMLLGVKFVFF